MIVVSHVSDTHVDAGQRSQERTRRVMQYLDALPGHLDAVLLTGDIADHGSEAEYETARSLLCARHPVLACPGNHDDRRTYRQAFSGWHPTTRRSTAHTSSATPCS